MNKVYLGDCLELMKDIADNYIDLTVTSPPYDNLRTYNGSLIWGEHIWKPIIKELYRITKQGGVVVWVVCDATIKGSETGTSFKQALWAKECGFNLHDTMIYEKANISFPDSIRYYSAFEYMFVFSKGKPKKFNPIMVTNPLAGKPVTSTKRGKNGIVVPDSGLINKKLRPEMSTIRNIWKYANGCQGIGQKHPAVFPLKLAQDHVLSWSNEGDLVFDPFAGSGTTAIAAINTNRNYILIEKEQKYYDIINKRIAEHTNQVNLF